MENEKNAYEGAQKMLDEKMISLQEKAKLENYQGIELRLTDEEGNVLIKGAMKVADLMALEETHTMSKGDAMKMFYAALEDDLKRKLEDEK